MILPSRAPPVRISLVPRPVIFTALSTLASAARVIVSAIPSSLFRVTVTLLFAPEPTSVRVSLSSAVSPDAALLFRFRLIAVSLAALISSLSAPPDLVSVRA